jgi:hypothetical protein
MLRHLHLPAPKQSSGLAITAMLWSSDGCGPCEPSYWRPRALLPAAVEEPTALAAMALKLQQIVNPLGHNRESAACASTHTLGWVVACS